MQLRTNIFILYLTAIHGDGSVPSPSSTQNASSASFPDSVLARKDNNSNISHSQSLEGKKNQIEKLAVSVYYETLCTYSKEFFKDQLIPVWNQLGDTYIDLKLIPFGNGQTFFQSGSQSFITTSCQHGEMECFGNKLHACSLEYLPKSVAQDFIFCSMSLDFPPDGVTNCSNTIGAEYNFTSDILESCVGSIAGDLALALRGLQSLDFVTGGVPSIAVNGVMAEGDEPFEDLLSYICQLLLDPPRRQSQQISAFQLPEACKNAKERKMN